MNTMNREQTKTTDERTESILELRDVSVGFEMGRGESVVLREVSIDIHRDEILGVVGESGSGKSMFASSLLDAVVEPGKTTGDITYYPKEGGEVDVLDLTPRNLKKLRWNEISMVFQGAMSSFNPTMKIEEHFTETLDAHNADISAGLERTREILEDVHLDAGRVLDSYPHELSGGMKQRALIALALVLEPEVLVMDEPTAALDLLMQRSILDLLEGIQEKYDITLIFITHDLPLVAKLCDRLAVMYAFNFIEMGPTESVIDDAAHPYTRALLNAAPDIGTPTENMTAIEGSSPDPVNVPSGCAYSPRCPISDQTCEHEEPPFHDVGNNQQATCFYWEESRQQIPLQHKQQEESK